MATRTVVITGCSSGIGRATAEAFLDAGWTVYATARDTDDVADLADAGCKTAPLDVTVGDDVEAVVDRMVDEDGRIDCLVNNAGFGQIGPVEDVPVETVQEQFAVNVYGPYRLMHAVLPRMREQASGTIVNVSSLAGRMGPPGMGVYAGSKFALEGISESLQGEVKKYGIDVTLLEPGPVKTSFAERSRDELEDIDRTEAYESAYGFSAQIESGAEQGAGSLGIDPTEVAELALDAAEADNPPLRQPVGPMAENMLD
jgi:NAD(P)-dependent dehydrogenase (short-subunit alcohol dehydrogenase family)